MEDEHPPKPSGPPAELKQISAVIWELPTSYKKGMLVPARIIANKELIESMDAGVFNQISNVASLPGIQKYAYCMPDGHWGYGFPIGGVAAFDPEQGGVISPGGIGFDINCLHPDTKILTSYGYFKKIKNFEESLDVNISFLNLRTKDKEKAKAALFLRKPADRRMLKISTKFGQEIMLSEDHPLYTGDKFQEAKQLQVGDKLITHPFIGVEHDEVEQTVLTEKEFSEIIGDRPKIINKLRRLGLLPLTTKSPKLPILARLMGFVTGDGWLGAYHSKTRPQEIYSMRVIGPLTDLEEVKKDIEELGYKANYFSTHTYVSEIAGRGVEARKIEGQSNQLHIGSQSLSLLLYALGVPKGNKSRIAVSIPSWIKESPLWIKRLYVAGLFGAELSKPTQRKGEPYGFIEPSISQNKIIRLEQENINFFLDFINLLSDLGIRINKIYRQKGVINCYGEETSKLILKISAQADNLITLWGTVGYEYCKERQQLAAAAVAYLKYKQKNLKTTKSFLENARQEFEKGSTTHHEIYVAAENAGLSRAMVKGQLYHRSEEVRITQDFIVFTDFVQQYRFGTNFILDEITEIEELDYDGFVYDFTMDNDNHNFIAEGIVSHNCGMRLLTTNLTAEEVKPHIHKLVDALYKAVPAGVGCKGFVKITKEQFKEVMRDGAQWCLKNGYAWESDIDHIEDHGKIAQANPEKVSDKAAMRGFNQLGTLGSGNHYLEIQEVREGNIFDTEAARVMGITKPGQIVIMVHCGSRGMGHQVGTDYLKIFLEVMPKYGITILDQELACAPFKSKEGQDYYAAMACAANMAFANRQVITHQIRKTFETVFGKTAQEMEMNLVYDVAHNIAKLEKYLIDGKEKKLLVHRKGSTRAFGPKHAEFLPKKYAKIGQPVIIGGSMETGSYLLVGTDQADEETFASTAHGAGRTMSRTKAKNLWRGDQLQKDMEHRGIYVHGVTMAGLAEEAGKAYKDIEVVVDSLEAAGITKRVVALKPIGNVKG